MLQQPNNDAAEHEFSGALREIAQIFKRNCVIYLDFKIDKVENNSFWRITLSNASSKQLVTTIDTDESFEPTEVIKYNLWGDDVSSAAHRPRSRYICLNVMHTIATLLVVLGFEVRVNDEDFDPYNWPNEKTDG